MKEGKVKVEIKNKRLKHSILICGVLLAVVGTPNALVFANDDGGYVVQEDKGIDCLPSVGSSNSDSKSKSSSSTNGTASSSEDAWLTEGTEQYEVAKKVFEVFTQEYGTSGAFAVGVLSNIKGESNFIPDVLEGGVRAGMNTPDGESYNSANPSAVGGGGLFQFTPYTKFSHSEWWKKRSGSDGWAVENQVDAVWGLEFGNRAVENYFSRTGKSNFSTVEDLISTDDPALASEYFQMAYERPQSFHSERAEWAKKANEVFNKDKVKADKSKFKFDGGSNSNSSVVDVKSKSSKGNGSLALGDCNTAEKTTVKSSGGAWGKDGTGTHNQNPSGWGIAWKPEDVPDDIKPYALDPTSLGVKYKGSYGTSLTSPNSDGWIDFGFSSPYPGQCTELAATLAWHIWQKGTDHLLHTAGDGGSVVGNMKSAFGEKGYSTTPKAGATFSTANAGAGHVGIVSHVFENGDVLIVEQNTPYSGQGAGMPNTWNYRLIAKAQVSSEFNAGFYYAGDVGYTVNPDAKTLG